MKLVKGTKAAAAATATDGGDEAMTRDVGIAISAPNIAEAMFICKGLSPLCVNRFSVKSQEQLAQQQAAGSQARSKKQREAKDFEALWRGACYRGNGWYGVHAASVRLALIDACRLVGFKMTLARMSVWVQPDGFDELDSTPLLRIYSDDEPVQDVRPVRNATGVVDLRSRPLWRNWEIRPRLNWDQAQFSVTDISNLLERAGRQIGICEGRPFSKNSAGIGFGTFTQAVAT